MYPTAGNRPFVSSNISSHSHLMCKRQQELSSAVSFWTGVSLRNNEVQQSK